MKIPRVRFVLILSLLIGLSSLPVSRVAAEISQAGGSNPKAETAHGFQIHFVQPHVSKLCVGQKTILEAEFGPDSFLTPLIDVSSITFWTSNGNSLSQESLYPFVKAGVVSSTFTAKNEGTDTLSVDVAVYHYENGTPSGEVLSDSDTTTIEVLKSCRYHYKLFGQLTVDIVEGEISESFLITIDSSGDLMAEDPDHPDLLTSENNSIAMTAIITNLTMPDCALISQDSGEGFGSVNASAEIDGDAKTIRFTLGPPQDFQWGKTAVGQCGDQQAPVSMSAMIPSEGNFIDGVDFSEDGGTLSIQLDFFEKGLDRLKSVATGSYTAMLSLEPGDSQ
ncbi:MAG TPA: hypothetical protein VII90_04490 [Anaerolineales bacterium]